MAWGTVTEEKLRELYNDEGMTYSEIADMYEGVTRNMVAGRMSRAGIMREPGTSARPRIAKQVAERMKADVLAREFSERKRDRRDPDILHDLDEGHSQLACAEHYGLKLQYIAGLARAASEAA